MKKITIFTLFVLFTSINGFAQHKCGAGTMKAQKLQNPEIAQQVADIEAFTQDWIQNNTASQRDVVTLPVVVHVLYTDAASNISDAQIFSQFDILNEDFRKLNSDFSTTPTAFQGIAADTEIEFCLASIDPNGNPTSGITRKQVSSDFDYEEDYYDAEFGGQTPWDDEKYINVWIGNLDPVELLGFAFSPGAFEEGEEGDGMVITYTAWGNIGAAASPNDLGRTATHEMGHYLNLDHVWGPEDGGCEEDDFVADTPLQYEENYGCDNIFPLFDDCTSDGNGVLFMNYMDYGDDACVVMFTQGQKERMLAAINGPRAGLLSSNACGTMTSTQNITEIKWDVFPNPTPSVLNIDFKENRDFRYEVLSLDGQIEKRGENDKTISISDLPEGIYFIKVYSNNDIFTKKIIKIK